MDEMGTVRKGGKNEFDNYEYIKESDVSQKLQAILVKHNVFIFSSIEESTNKQVTSSAGKPNIFSRVKIKYTFVDADNPDDKFEVYSAGDGMDRGDKAIYKAITGAHKYFMIRNFSLGADDDAEKDSHGIGSDDNDWDHNPKGDVKSPANNGKQKNIYDEFGI